MSSAVEFPVTAEGLPKSATPYGNPEDPIGIADVEIIYPGVPTTASAQDKMTLLALPPDFISAVICSCAKL